jgi:hypothetical protein
VYGNANATSARRPDRNRTAHEEHAFPHTHQPKMSGRALAGMLTRTHLESFPTVRDVKVKHSRCCGSLTDAVGAPLSD